MRAPSRWRLVLDLAPLRRRAPPTATAAKDKPWILDANNWQEGKDLLPEPVLKRLKNGEYWFKVVAGRPGRSSSRTTRKTFWDATRGQRGQVRPRPEDLRPEGQGDRQDPDFLFGLPFPKIDKNDPQAGCKIARNFTFAGHMGGGGGATFTLNGIDGNGEFRRVKAFIHAHGLPGPPRRPDRGQPREPRRLQAHRRRARAAATSRASRRSPSATGTGRARTPSGPTCRRPAAPGA